MTSVTSPETEDDLVPLLRGDLVITPSPQSRGTRDVTDPLTNKTFTLYDFEVSIARMLDGKRTAGAVINAANRLGIPVTLPTLRTFLSQLRAYQFIDTSTPVAENTTWEPRRKWTAEARELYQSALRLLRSGKFEEARGYVDALVAADPDNEEVAPLRARIDAAAAGNGDLNAPFDELAAQASSAPLAIEDEPPLPVPSLGVTQAEPDALPFESSASSISIEVTAPLAKLMSSSLSGVTVETTEPSVATTPVPRTTSLPTLPLEITQAVAAPLPTDHLPPLDPHATIPAMPSAPEVTDPIAAPLPDTAQTMEPLPPVGDEAPARVSKKPAAPKKSKRPLIIAAVAVLGIAGVLLRPVEARVTLPCELKAVTLGTANSPRAGSVKQAEVQSGEFVAKGSIIARLELSLDNGPATLAAKQDELEKELAALGKPNAAKVKKAKVAVKKAELGVKFAEKAAAKAKGKKVALAAKTLENKEAALKKAQAALENVTHDAKRAELKAAMDALGASGDSAKDAASRSVIEAPVDGVVLLPELPGRFEENAAFAQLVEAKLNILTAGALPEGATKATLKLGAVERPVPVQNGKATVTLDPALVNAKGELIFPGRKQPWVLSLLGQ